MGIQYIHTEYGYDLLLFMLKIETTTWRTNFMPILVFRLDHLRSTSGIISGLGSFVVQFGDHSRSGSFASLYSPWSSRPKQRGPNIFYTEIHGVDLCKSNLSSALSFLHARERNLSNSRHGQVVCGETLSIVEVNSLLFLKLLQISLLFE